MVKRKSNLSRDTRSARRIKKLRRQEGLHRAEERRRIQAARQALLRAAETPEERQARRQRHAEYMASKRAAESQKQAQARRKRHAEYMATKRAAESLEEKQARRRRHAENRAIKRAAETPEEAEARRRRHAEYVAIKRAAEKPEEAEARWRRHAEYVAIKRAAETPEDVEARRNATRIRQPLSNNSLIEFERVFNYKFDYQLHPQIETHIEIKNRVLKWKDEPEGMCCSRPDEARRPWFHMASFGADEIISIPGFFQRNNHQGQVNLLQFGSLLPELNVNMKTCGKRVSIGRPPKKTVFNFHKRKTLDGVSKLVITPVKPAENKISPEQADLILGVNSFLEDTVVMGSRMKTNGASRRKDIDLNMECGEEELSEAQLSAYNKAMIQFRETSDSIDNLLRAGIIDITERGLDYIAIEFKEGLNGVNGTKVKPTVQPAIQPSTARPSAGVQTSTPSILLSNAGVPQTAGTYQLVMDSRGTVYLGSSTSTTSTSPSSNPVPVMQGVIPPNVPVAAAISPPSVLRPAAPATAVRSMGPRSAVRQTTPRASTPTSSPALVPLSNMVNNKAGVRGGTTAVRIRPSAQTKANEATSVGGIVQNKPGQPVAKVAAVVDLTDDDGKTNMAADSREVQFNKLSGKTYPSLVVVARPNLRVKEFSQAQTHTERTSLDAKMKAVLMGTPTKFTEWLIQQGLVRSEQHCSIHVNPDMSPIKLKLGMYSDVSKFPYSGGYVWISECCPTRFVSVFSGSIFEGAPHAPTVLVKLLYHWACQTSVNNISQWVKVDGLYVKSFYTNIRAVCTAAVHEKFDKLGGPKKRVELGVISLGTTSQDGNMRQVKVEVLGVFDPESKLIRLRAVEPLQDGERNYKRRFVKILEPLEEWVHKESIILTDYTVDKGTLHQMGYQSVYQVSIQDQQGTSAKYSNTQVMEYLRRIVPRMFQNTLSLLSRQIIQQFLDELVWRERWGTIAPRAFETMITHLAEQTKLDTGDTLMTRLNKIASNPFKNWAYKNWQANCSTTTVQQPTRLVVGTNNVVTPKVIQQPNPDALPSIDNLPPSLRNTDSPGPVTSQTAKRSRNRGKAVTEPEPKKRSLSSSNSSAKLQPLDSYYYGSKPGNRQSLAAQKTFDLNMKCGMCHMVIKDNLRMMRHLVGHAFNEGSYTFSDSSPQCRYCLKDFLSEFALQSHVEETHEKGALVCQICREANRDRTTLILHMHHNHCELELPYHCGICQFRASQHKVVVDHFHEVHKNTDKLQCPFCLKIVNLQTVDGRKITQNQYFFINHIQKHQRKTLARKCSKCVLWFVHKDLIKEHQMKDHNSCKDLSDVVRFPVNGMDAVMMPTPLSTTPQVKSQGSKNKTQFVSNFTINNFQRLRIEGVGDGATCCECEGEVLQEDHYPGFLSCLKCRFSTCCSKAMNEHFVIFHDRVQAKPQFNVGKAIILEKPLYCVCGFSSRSGNKLARHLADCKRKSAYPSPERAAQCTLQGQSASFPPLVTLDEEGDAQDHEEKWLRAFAAPRTEAADAEKPAVASTSSGDPPSMLNLLGLVRKPSSDDDNNEAMEVDDK